MKRNLLILPLLALILLVASPVDAVTRDTTDPGASTGEPSTVATPSATTTTTTKTKKTIEVDSAKETARAGALAEYKAAKTDAVRLEKLKTVGQKAIDTRIAFLETLTTRVSEKTISEADKAVLTKDIAAQITALKTLRITITAESDLTKIKAQIRSIYSERFVFALFVPKTRGLAAVSRLDTTLTKLATAQTAAEAYLAERKAAGTDVTAGELALADFVKQIEAVKTAQALAKTKFTAITLTDLAGGRTLIKEGKTALQTAKTALAKARADLATIKGI